MPPYPADAPREATSGLPAGWVVRRINGRAYTLCDCCGSIRHFKGGVSTYLQEHLGVSEYATPLDVYMSKVHGTQPDETRAMRRGRVLEPFIASEYALETGRHVTDPGATEILYHPDLPMLGATLDRVTTFDEDRDGMTGPLEIKSVGHWKGALTWEDGVPLRTKTRGAWKTASWSVTALAAICSIAAILGNTTSRTSSSASKSRQRRARIPGSTFTPNIKRKAGLIKATRFRSTAATRAQRTIANRS